MHTYGFLISCEGRDLFVRSAEDAQWAFDDERYTVKQLVAADEIQPVVIYKPAVSQGFIQPDFEAYQELAEELNTLHDQQLSSTKQMLEDSIELIEGIGELSAKKTENLMELRGLLLLIHQDCKKFLAPE